MEASFSKYQFWSPPTLDLSLDSFSNDLIQEFDKTRSSISISTSNNNVSNYHRSSIATTVDQKRESVTIATEDADSIPPPEDNEQEEQQIKILEVSGAQEDDIVSSSSPIASLVTLPPSEREVSIHEEDASSAANLFRRSSTFLKKKLSVNSRNNESNSSRNSITATSAEGITNIVSRQYPPKPLHYSPIVEPPSDDMVQASTTTSNTDNSGESSPVMVEAPTVPSSGTSTLSRARREVALTKTTTVNNTSKRMSDPASTATANLSNPAITTGTATATATATAIPKRRSFFSLRFC